ncbi:MAG: N-acetylglucosamine-6-phosphate deacetylase [Gammaproteobacteria bacterium]
MEENNRHIFYGMQILLDQKWSTDQAVIVEHEEIKSIVPTNMMDHHMPATLHAYPEDHYLIPGLIDLHVHGAKGYDVMDGTEKALTALSSALAAEGVTGFLATTMTATDEHLEKVLQVIAARQPTKEGAAILGVHLEGPFLAKAKVGAQNENLTQLPNIDLVIKWQKLAQGAIKVVTLAPELPDAITFIRDLRSLGMCVAIGHTNATYAETMEAVDAGCSQATHLFNAMRGIAQREPGAAGALLLADNVVAELVCDGIHLHPAIVDLAFRVKGRDRLLLVSDAMRAKCMKDGRYELGGQEVNVKKGKTTLDDGTIAGSTLQLPQAIKHMSKYAQCSLEGAIRMAAYNPARTLGLSDRKGSISLGKDADLVVLNSAFKALLTMRAGTVVFEDAAYHLGLNSNNYKKRNKK